MTDPNSKPTTATNPDQPSAAKSGDSPTKKQTTKPEKTAAEASATASATAAAVPPSLGSGDTQSELDNGEGF